MARRDGRSWGCREVERATKAKTATFLDLYEWVFSVKSTAAKLGIPEAEAGNCSASWQRRNRSRSLAKLRPQRWGG